ncbi:MAG: hypothetical protein JW787_04225 [Sedimentisphaerales bacterium]|nr:hypothetical protein [Sedimentisphaerales bacterium]
MTNQLHKESFLTIYHKGIWKAEPGIDEFYSPGEIFIKVNNKKSSKVQVSLGKDDIPDKNNLIEIIDEVSQAMIKSLGCERVYCVSLCESESDLHFRLFPRYREDEGFLDEYDKEIEDTNDGFALMAKWRRQFILKNLCTDKEFINKLRKKHYEAINKVWRELRNKS